MKHIVWIPALLLFFISLLSQPQTTPTLKELKALRSIRGEISGSIVWTTMRHGNWQIYKMKADGTGKVRLTKDKERNYQPVWSKDGKWIYYQRNDDIFRMRPDGSDSQIEVKDGGCFDLSRDGLKLIYVQEDKDDSSIILYDLVRKRAQEIIPARVPEFTGKTVSYPTISPDGQWIAFASTYPRAWTIHVVKKEGSSLYPFAGGCMPQYRPDGSMIAWITSVQHEVYIAAPDGKNRKLFVKAVPGRQHCYFPKWSNNGEYIVFSASPHFDRGTSDYEVFIKSLKGGGAVRLTFNPASDIWPDIFITEEGSSE